MKIASVLMAGALIGFGGCLSAPPAAPTNWTIGWPATIPADVTTRITARKPIPCDVRLSVVTVRAPYNGFSLAVLRPDGSVAFDKFNTFAAVPASLLRGATEDALVSSKFFRHVVGATSSAKATHTLEVDVSCLALDCREDGRRDARVELALTLLCGRETVGMGRGKAAVDASSGNYSTAFSESFLRAIVEASGHLNAESNAK